MSARWDEYGRLEYLALSPGADCDEGWAALTAPGLTLRSDGYDWRFLPVAGKSFTDSGSGSCH